MYLKRLEMQGFKSFADRIELNFPFGVTAIVGPNGSGKSNISDALRWVLGEQSIKTLRGAKMDDVIFIGSETRKPMGMAEVTVVLDNSDGNLPLDYREVAITRRLYRSGEGECLINRTPVRLKDIHELLYDTGLGKEAYSVIGQGKIDAILSARAEDRRAVFEEAAGIVKYKNKKLAALKKLADTDNHLVRVEDILREITGQMVPVREQEALARRYLAFQTELESIEINHLGAEIQRLQEEFNQTEGRLKDLATRLEDEKRRELTYEASLSELKLRLARIDDEIAKEQELFLGLTAEKGRLAGEDDLLAEKMRSHSARLKELEQELARIRQKTQTVQDDQNRIDQEIRSIQIRRCDAEERAAAEESALQEKNGELAEAKKAEEAVRAEILSLHDRISDLKNQKNAAVLQKEFQNRQLLETEQRLNAVEEAESQVLQRLKKIQEEIREKAREQAEQQNLINLLKEEIVRNETELNQNDGKIQDYRQAAQRLADRLGILEEMERGYHGYFQGVKSVLTETGQEDFSRQIRGVVADLLQTENGFEIAVEVALGSALQFVVIESDAAAEEAVAFLKKNNHGRATFLPLNLVEGEAVRFPADLLQAHRSRSAMEIVRFDAVYRKIIAHLLGQTIVAPDLKTAVRLSQALGKRYRIVTTDGEIIAPGGAITGGSLDRRRVGILSRRKEIEELRRERERLLKLAEQTLKIREATREKLQEARRAFEEATEAAHRRQVEMGALAKELETSSERREQLAREIGELKTRAENLRAELAEETLSDQGVLTALLETETQLGAAQTNLQTIMERIAQLQSARDEAQNVLAGLRAELLRLEQEEAGKADLKAGLIRQMREAEDEARRLEEEMIRVQEANVQTERDRNTVKERLTRLERETSETDGRLNGWRTQREALRAEINAGEEKIKAVRLTVNGLQQQIHRMELQLNRCKLTMESLARQLTESYGLNWDKRVDAAWVPPPDPQGRIEELRKELKELGPVNIGAIEELQRLQERHDFLQQQLQDLVNAKNTLERVIAEIERTIRRRFLETFAEIRQAFMEIFNSLFAGGKADLILIDPDDPLESGIEILAQPPGKRLQSLTLLSGGERAMIAIALLFAILKVKPSPFCVLDEIDATLDDVNVNRFSDLLADFSKELQFIVVTHRRGTMEIANAIYGVTMEELGVSKLISIDLQKKVG